jgi:hypothetical protein
MDFKNFNDFYRFYLTQHTHRWCRYFHYLGLSLVLISLAIILLTGAYLWLLLLPVIGYGCSWIGHYGFEKNTPATFSHPFYSFLGDWLMYRDWLLSPLKKRA